MKFRESDIYIKITGFPLHHHCLTVISGRLCMIWSLLITLWYWFKNMSSVKWWSGLSLFFFLWRRKLSRDGTRLEENYLDAEPAVDYAIDSMNFPVYLRCGDMVFCTFIRAFPEPFFSLSVTALLYNRWPFHAMQTVSKISRFWPERWRSLICNNMFVRTRKFPPTCSWM